MASLETKQNRKGLNIKVLFTLNRVRKKLCLGSKYSRKQAEEIKVHVENLVSSLETGGRLSRSTVAFVDSMTDDLRRRFESVGLVHSRQNLTNSEIWDRYIAESELKRKKSTVVTCECNRVRFFEFFDENGLPSEITSDDCIRFKAYLESKGYARSTVAEAITRVKTVFRWAINKEYINRNPFRAVEIESGAFENPERMFFVTMDAYEKILKTCPDQFWRTLITLCRIGGLRHPSETTLLTWGDVNWEQNKLVVHSPKTERHRGKATRIIPLFPRLREELEHQFELAEPGGSPYIIGGGKRSCLRDSFIRIILRAGIMPWPRLFQNLRESRANELWSQYPDHVAQAWMGHSKNTANKFYLQVQDVHFQQAVKDSAVEMFPKKITINSK